VFSAFDSCLLSLASRLTC